MSETTSHWLDRPPQISGILAGQVLQQTTSNTAYRAIGYRADALDSSSVRSTSSQVRGTGIVADMSYQPVTSMTPHIGATSTLFANTAEARKTTLPLSRLKGRLRAFKFLEPNWNGYGGVVPTRKSVEDCIKVLDNLGDLPVLPSPTVSGDGEVGLFWEQAGVTIEIGCRGDGHYGYLVEIPGQPWKEDEGVLLTEIHPTIRGALQLLALT